MNIRQQIIDELKARLQTIKVENGYTTNAGKYVSVWEGNPFQLNDDTKYRVEIRDTEGANLIEEVNHSDQLHTHLITVIINITAVGGTPAVTLRQLLNDVNKAVWHDKTFSGLAQTVYLATNDINEIEHNDDIYMQATTVINIQYRTIAGEI